MSTKNFTSAIVTTLGSIDIDLSLAAARETLTAMKAEDDKANAAVAETVEQVLAKNPTVTKWVPGTLASMVINASGGIPDGKNVEAYSARVKAFLDSKPDTFLYVGTKGPNGGYHARAALSAEQLQKLQATIASAAKSA